MTTLLRSPVEPLRRILKQQRRELGAYSVTKRVEGRNADGTISVRRLDGECIERSTICSAYPGQLVQVPCGNGFRNLGAAGTAVARTSSVAGTIWVESLDPNVYAPGQSYTVTVTGRGFREGITAFAFLLPDSDEVNDDVTITGSSYLSETEWVLEIELAADAALITDGRGGLAFDNPGFAL